MLEAIRKSMQGMVQNYAMNLVYTTFEKVERTPMTDGQNIPQNPGFKYIRN